MLVLISLFLILALSAEALDTYGFHYVDLSAVIVSLPWMRYILASHKPTLRSYFTWDKAYLVSMAYTIILISLPMFLLEKGLSYMDPVFTGRVVNVSSLFMHLVIVLLFVVITGPVSFIFPTIALNKPFSLGKTFRDVLPFYGQYLISMFLALLRLIFIMLPLFAIGVFTMILAIFHPEYIPAGVTPYLLAIFLLVSLLSIYFWVTYCYTILTAYYKKHLMQ